MRHPTITAVPSHARHAVGNVDLDERVACVDAVLASGHVTRVNATTWAITTWRRCTGALAVHRGSAVSHAMLCR